MGAFLRHRSLAYPAFRCGASICAGLIVASCVHAGSNESESAAQANARPATITGEGFTVTFAPSGKSPTMLLLVKPLGRLIGARDELVSKESPGSAITETLARSDFGTVATAFAVNGDETYILTIKWSERGDPKIWRQEIPIRKDQVATVTISEEAFGAMAIQTAASQPGPSASAGTKILYVQQPTPSFPDEKWGVSTKFEGRLDGRVLLPGTKVELWDDGSRKYGWWKTSSGFVPAVDLDENPPAPADQSQLSVLQKTVFFVGAERCQFAGVGLIGRRRAVACAGGQLQMSPEFERLSDDARKRVINGLKTVRDFSVEYPAGGLYGTREEIVILGVPEAAFTAEVAVVEQPTQCDVVVENIPCPAEILSDGRYVYWVATSTVDENHHPKRDGQLARVPVRGGRTTVLADHLNWPVSLALDGTTLYLIDSGSLMSIDLKSNKTRNVLPELKLVDGYGLLAENGLVLFSAGSGIYAVSAKGGKPVDVVEGLELPRGLASDKDTTYCALANGHVLAIPKAGGQAEILTSAASSNYENVAVGNGYVYYPDREGGMKRYPVQAEG
jgi:hypothetical protein